MANVRDEGLWNRAKAAVAKSRRKGEGAFTDLDWGLVMKIYKSMGGR